MKEISTSRNAESLVTLCASFADRVHERFIEDSNEITIEQYRALHGKRGNPLKIANRMVYMHIDESGTVLNVGQSTRGLRQRGSDDGGARKKKPWYQRVARIRYLDGSGFTDSQLCLIESALIEKHHPEGNPGRRRKKET